MRTAVLGTGFVGRAVIEELAARGHDVVAVARHPDPTLPVGVDVVAGDVHDPDVVARATHGVDVVVNALAPVGDGGALPDTTALLRGAAEAAGARLVVVGSSAVLPVRPGGPRLADDPGFPAFLADRVEAHTRTLAALAEAPDGPDWLYLAVAGEFGTFAPGTRTGRYRTSTTALVADDDGRSHVGVADYALALVDELERPTVHRGWLAVGY